MKEKIASVGGESFVGDKAEVEGFIQRQTQRMEKVIRDGNIRPE